VAGCRDESGRGLTSSGARQHRAQHAPGGLWHGGEAQQQEGFSMGWHGMAGQAGQGRRGKQGHTVMAGRRAVAPVNPLPYLLARRGKKHDAATSCLTPLPLASLPADRPGPCLPGGASSWPHDWSWPLPWLARCPLCWSAFPSWRHSPSQGMQVGNKGRAAKGGWVHLHAAGASQAGISGLYG